MGPKQPAKNIRKGVMDRERSEAMVQPQLESLAASGLVGRLQDLRGSALPQAAPSVKAAPSSCRRPSGLTAWASEKRKGHIWWPHQPLKEQHGQDWWG